MINSVSSPVIYEMHESIKNLSKHGFSFVNLYLTEEEKGALYTFSIHGDGDYNYYSDLDRLQTELPNSLASVGCGNVTVIAAIIHRIALQVVKAAGKETALVIVRVSTPNSDYDLPRWHIDGEYYPGSWLKFASALIGNPTLFYPLQPEQREPFNASMTKMGEIACQLIDANAGVLPTGSYCDQILPERIKVSELLSNQPIIGRPGEGAFFRVADMNTGGVHSEPKIDGPRLFFSVLPGTEEEIAYYKN